jgi:hypothetical protein
MNVASFFKHWGIVENPFRAEEARHDSVFARLSEGPTTHPDFDKVVGDLATPASSILFGEKGSGKTAIRLQLEHRVASHNVRAQGERVLLVPYDDLNPVLDRIASTAGVSETSPEKKITQALERVRLVDHMDAILSAATTRLVSFVLKEQEPRSAAIPGLHTLVEPARELRRQPDGVKRDLMVLAALFDAPDGGSGEPRARRLRRAIRARGGAKAWPWGVLTWLGWLPAAAVVGLFIWLGTRDNVTPWLIGLYVALGLWAIVLLKTQAWDRFVWSRTAGKLSRQLRAVPKSSRDFGKGLLQLTPDAATRETLPLNDSDDVRYAMFDRLRRVIRPLGCSGVVVLIDRVDEPTLVAGNAERMRSVVWPMLNAKFLQMDRVGVKMLLPIELRYELFRESSTFFQEARLDKQNLVERLSWTGAMLYDLCSARLNACRDANQAQEAQGEPLMLVSLFDEDVARQDVVDALDQMNQPRDAFKLLYQCIQEHCANVTEDQNTWRIPRLTLDAVRRQQAGRLQEFSRGIRPA